MKLNRQSIVITSVILLFIASITAICLVLLNMGAEQNTAGGNIDDIDPRAQAWDNELPGASKMEMKGTIMQGYGVARVLANDKNTEFTLPNPGENNCYFQFIFKLGDETLYTSGLVEPGNALTSQTLRRGLSAGEYELTISIVPYSLETKEPLVAVNMQTKLIAEQ